MGDLIVSGLKIAFTVAVSITFMLAISTFINLLSAVVFHSVVGEILGVVSCFLPFNASSVFNGINLALSAILAFMIATKIFDLTSNHVEI